MIARDHPFAEATQFLRKRDRRLRAVIDRVGPCTLKLKRDRFATLVQSIISQQVSVQAAKVIFAQLKASLQDQVTASQILQRNLEQLRRAGTVSSEGDLLAGPGC